MIRDKQRAPRLLYLADVPVESSYHGSTLIFRLLKDYSPGQLLVMEGIQASLAERRLPDVVYRTPRLGNERLLRTRFSRLYSSWLFSVAACKAGGVERVLNGFIPEAVLTVAHGFSWLTAAAFARDRRLPLYLIVHDDLPMLSLATPALRGRVRNEFARVYRQAASRFCVSPYMEEEYHHRYSVRGTLLYPSRAPDCPLYVLPPDSVRKNVRGLSLAFAGTLDSPSYIRLLSVVADCLKELGGRVIVFGPYTASNLESWGLDLSNVQCLGLLPSRELIDRLRSEADVLFVPMSFEQGGEQDNMRFSFPSKLADYTAAGLPLLICGPSYSSAVRWAKQYRPIAEVVETETRAALWAALEQLLSPHYRETLARRALELGSQLFSHAKAQEVFYSALSSNKVNCK